jgi:hypothetical protein
MGRCHRNDQEDKPERDSATFYIHVKIPAKIVFKKEGLPSEAIFSPPKGADRVCYCVSLAGQLREVQFPFGKWIRYAAQATMFFT